MVAGDDGEIVRVVVDEFEEIEEKAEGRLVGNCDAGLAKRDP